jgi:quercetin dioxygenase-like cupin family protein
MEIIRQAEVESLVNGSVVSEQLLFPENSKSERVTITRVTFAPGAKSPRHMHAASEQVLVALRGTGTLLLEGSATAPFAEGDVVRFADGDVHGFENTGHSEFVYLAVTSPPINFRGAYAKEWRDSGDAQKIFNDDDAAR